MFKVTKIKKKISILSLAFFSVVIAIYALNEGQPFLSLYNNGLDVVLGAVIKSETSDRINDLIISLDTKYFKVMIGFFFFLLMIFFLLNSKKIIFSNKFYDFFKLSEFRPEFFKNSGLNSLNLKKS